MVEGREPILIYCARSSDWLKPRFLWRFLCKGMGVGSIFSGDRCPIFCCGTRPPPLLLSSDSPRFKIEHSSPEKEVYKHPDRIFPNFFAISFRFLYLSAKMACFSIGLAE